MGGVVCGLSAVEHVIFYAWCSACCMLRVACGVWRVTCGVVCARAVTVVATTCSSSRGFSTSPSLLLEFWGTSLQSILLLKLRSSAQSPCWSTPGCLPCTSHVPVSHYSRVMIHHLHRNIINFFFGPCPLFGV
jgi:hypothetical protein